MAIPFRGSFQHSNTFSSFPPMLREVIRDWTFRRVEARDKPPSFEHGTVGMQFGSPGDRRMGLKQEEEKNAAVFVEFVESVKSIGDLSYWAWDFHRTGWKLNFSHRSVFEFLG